MAHINWVPTCTAMYDNKMTASPRFCILQPFCCTNLELSFALYHSSLQSLKLTSWLGVWCVCVCMCTHVHVFFIGTVCAYNHVYVCVCLSVCACDHVCACILPCFVSKSLIFVCFCCCFVCLYTPLVCTLHVFLYVVKCFESLNVLCKFPIIII